MADLWRRRAGACALAAGLAVTAGAPSTAQAEINVDTHHGSVAWLDATAGTLSGRVPPAVAAGRGPSDIAVNPDGRSVYVANDLSNTISQYDIAPDGGLSPKPAPTVPTGKRPSSLGVSPDGRRVYVTNAADGSLWQYDVLPSGAVVPRAAPVSAPLNVMPVAIAVHPDGRSVYVLTEFGTATQYRVGPDGALSVGSSLEIDLSSATDIAVGPDGRSVYVTAYDRTAPYALPTVFQFDVGPGGALTAKPEPKAVTGWDPTAIVLAPDGRHAYVTYAGSRANGFRTGVVGHDVGADGAIGESGKGLALDGIPAGIAVAPDGRRVFVSKGPASFLQYGVEPGGAPAPAPPSEVRSGYSPGAIAVHPDGRSVYVVHAGAAPVRCPAGTSPSVLCVRNTRGGLTIVGTELDEAFVGTGAADRIDGEGGDDRLYGRSGSDELSGADGRDRLYGGGGGGNDQLRGGRGRDRLDCGAGRDRAVRSDRDRVAGNCERRG